MSSTKEEPIFAALESTYNDGAVPVGGDAILAADIPAFDPLANANFSERNVVRAGTIAKAAGIYGGAAPTLSFPVELKGSGALGVAPEWGRLLRACGFVETINPGVSVVYTPRPQGTTFESLSIYHWQGNTRYHLTGVRGTAVIRGEVGQNPVIEFNFTCRMVDGSHATVAQLAPTFDATTPIAFRDNNFLSLNAFNPSFTTFSADLQNAIAIGRNANTADGFGEIRINERQVAVALDPEQTDLATRDWLDDIQQGNTTPLSLIHGAVGGNRVNIAMPVIKPNSLSFGDRDQTRTLEYGYVAEETAALNDEITITLD